MWDLSSRTRDSTLIPCIGRQIFNHWSTREVPSVIFNSEKKFAIRVNFSSKGKCLSKLWFIHLLQYNFLKKWCTSLCVDMERCLIYYKVKTSCSECVCVCVCIFKAPAHKRIWESSERTHTVYFCTLELVLQVTFFHIWKIFFRVLWEDYLDPSI